MRGNNSEFLPGSVVLSTQWTAPGSECSLDINSYSVLAKSLLPLGAEVENNWDKVNYLDCFVMLLELWTALPDECFSDCDFELSSSAWLCPGPSLEA